LSRIGFRAKLGRSREKRREDRVGFLVENFHIDPKQLVAVGFGEEKLKNPENPLAAENSRPTRTLRPKPLHPLPAPAGREAAAVIW
jgi:hypothetical protein